MEIIHKENRICRKLRESLLIGTVEQVMSQPSLDMGSMWLPLQTCTG
jgi:hypothetical protein